MITRIPPRIPPKKPEPAKKKRRGSSGPKITQTTPMQRVMIIGPTGKRRMEWRPW